MSIDKQRIGQSFARHYGEYDRTAVVQRRMAEQLAAALETAAPQLRVMRALEIGVGTGFLTRLLTERYPDAEWWFNDLSPAAFDWLPPGLAQVNTLAGDAEALDYPVGLDLLASASALQWFEDLPAFFAKARRVMRPGAILAVATFGAGHFRELGALPGRALRYPTAEALRGMVRAAGFTPLFCETRQETLLFESARALLAHLRSTGVNGAATGSIRTPSQLRAFEVDCRAAHPTANGSLPLSYEPLLLIARAG